LIAVAAGVNLMGMKDESQATQLIHISNQQPEANSLVDPRDAAGAGGLTPRTLTGLRSLLQQIAQTENHIQVMIRGPIAIAVVVVAILAGLFLLR
jgi:hypothetical protein